MDREHSNLDQRTASTNNGSPDQSTLLMVNIFIINTVQMLNKISDICERKLGVVHRRILSIDLTLKLLEAKLRSVDGIKEELLAPKSPSTIPVSEDASLIVSESQLSDSTTSGSKDEIRGAPDASICLEQQFPKVRDDSRYSKFVRMLQVGVLEQAVKLQMSLEGYDPAEFDEVKSIVHG